MKRFLTTKTPLEEVRATCSMCGLRVFKLRGWFGNGFLAVTPGYNNGVNEGYNNASALVVREKQGILYAQCLEHPSSIPVGLLESLKRAGVLVEKYPYNPTPRGYAYRLEYLALIDELRQHAFGDPDFNPTPRAPLRQFLGREHHRLMKKRIDEHERRKKLAA